MVICLKRITRTINSLARLVKSLKASRTTDTVYIIKDNRRKNTGGGNMWPRTIVL